MPSFHHVRQVGFAPAPQISRLPKGDELQAMANFAHHADHCKDCRDPWYSHLSNKTLCDRGHLYARDVAKYVYSKADKPYARSHADEDEHSDHPVRIEIPVGYGAVRGLLKAMERGLKLRRSALKSAAAPVISYDRTYPVGPRPVSSSHGPKVQVVEPPRQKKPSKHTSHRSSSHHHHHHPARAEKVVYMDSHGFPLNHNAPVAMAVPQFTEPLVFYAAPRHSSSSSRHHRRAFDEFYR